MHERVLYSLAMALAIYALFVLWVWTGPLGASIAAFTTHYLLRLGEAQRDGSSALARKTKDMALREAFTRSSA